ncbi:hypothetical protein J6590_020128 [Homalodisca vitripennis]|nr:hypothetical protein J6590_020128 [Homalodisca vitripennis]
MPPLQEKMTASWRVQQQQFIKPSCTEKAERLSSFHNLRKEFKIVLMAMSVLPWFLFQTIEEAYSELRRSTPRVISIESRLGSGGSKWSRVERYLHGMRLSETGLAGLRLNYDPDRVSACVCACGRGAARRPCDSRMLCSAHAPLLQLFV